MSSSAWRSLRVRARKTSPFWRNPCSARIFRRGRAGALARRGGLRRRRPRLRLRGGRRRGDHGARRLRAHEHRRELRALEERLLERRALAPERRVAVGIAAEALEHVDVLLGPDLPRAGDALLPAGAAGRDLGDAGERAADVGQVLGVRQRHEEERRLGGGEGAVEAALERVLGEREAERVAGEGPRGRAIDVARELVEQEDEGEAAARGLAPVVELAAGGAVHQRFEVLLDLLVDRRAAAKPQRLVEHVVLRERVADRARRAREVAVRKPVVPDAGRVEVAEGHQVHRPSPVNGSPRTRGRRAARCPGRCSPRARGRRRSSSRSPASSRARARGRTARSPRPARGTAPCPRRGC